MKVRYGFVSNSSSSSFVIIAKKDAFDKALNEWTVSDDLLQELRDEDVEAEGGIKEYIYQYVKEYFDEQVLFGNDVYTHHDLNIQGYSDYDEIPWPVREEIEAIIDSLNDNDVFSSSNSDG